jgi:hypothetical protein
MNLSLTEIHRRRGELLQRAQAERVEVKSLLGGQSNLFWLADRALEAIRFCAARKVILAIGALAFAVVQPRRALRWAVKAWGLFRLVRKIGRAFT